MGEELQNLLERINVDGIQKAEAEAEKIIDAARSEAETIVNAARKEASAIIAGAETDAEAFHKRAVSAAGQAARDIRLQLRSELTKRLNAAVKDAVGAALTPEFMTGLIKELTAAFVASPDSELKIRCAIKDVAALDVALKGALADSLKKSPVLFGSPEISGGIQLEFNDADCCFDFTDAAVQELLADYCGEQLAAVFKAE